MSSKRPDEYVDPTAMAHPLAKPAETEARAAAASDAAAAAPTEEELKCAEKVRSHASSHHTAGTVKPDG